MYALVVCLDNIKRVIPAHYIQRRDEDGSIAVFLPEKQQFCNAVVLDKNDNRDILVAKMTSCPSKRKQPSTSYPAPTSPASKRLRGPSPGTYTECGQLHLQSRSPGPAVPELVTETVTQVTETQVTETQVTEREVTDRPIKKEYPEDDQWEYEGCHGASFDVNSRHGQHNDNTGQQQPLPTMTEGDNPLSLGNDVSLTRLLCEVLEDQRALARRVHKMEGTLQQVLETVSKTNQMIAQQGQSQHEVNGIESPPTHPSHNEDSGTDYYQSDDEQSEAVQQSILSIKSEEIDTELSESHEHDSSFRTVSPGLSQNDQAGSSCSQQSSQLQKIEPEFMTASLLRPDTNVDGETTMNQSTIPLSHEKSRLTVLQNEFVVIQIMHHDLTPDTPHNYIRPVLIPIAEYRNLVLRSKTPTAFCRTLLKYFFSKEILKTHNFSGGPVRTKLGKVIRGQLNQRMVLTLIDQVEQEYPGSTRGRGELKQLKKAINDKCNHL